MPFSNNIVNNYQLNSGNTPLLYPVRIVCPQGVQTNISFPDQFLGRAINLKITNNDGTNAASYDYNLNSVFANLASGTFATLDNAVVNYLTVIAGADGGTLSQTLTDMGAVTLFSLISGAVDPQTAINTADISTNATAIAGLTTNKGKWSATNVATFKTSVIAGVQAGTIEEVT